MPRVLFEGWSKDAWERAAGNVVKVTDVLLDTCQKHNFDGFVLELWSQGLPVGAPVSWLVRIVKHIGRELLRQGLDVFVVVPPVSEFSCTFHHLQMIHVDLSIVDAG